MRQPKGVTEYGHGACCPDEFNHCPCITGNHEMDASIMRGKNTDMQRKIMDHIGGEAYKINTAYHHTTQD